MKLTAFIPVYQTIKRAAESARILAAECRKDCQIVIVIDGDTTPDIETGLAAVRGIPSISIVEGRPHLGKAAALNSAVRDSDAEGFFFLDNDIILKAGTGYFDLADLCLSSCDIAEIPKVGTGKGILASMVEIEFLVNVIATDYLVSRSGRCPAMNGAAFLVKAQLFRKLDGFRAVLNEDMDFAARAFFAKARTGFDPALTVENEVPESFSIWFRQRRRWAINAPMWARVHGPRVRREAPELTTDILKSGLVFPLPFISFCICLCVLLLPLPAGAFLIPSRLLSILTAILIFGSVEAWIAAGARKYGTGFRIHAYILFSLFYLPVWGFAYLQGLVAVLKAKIPDLGWKYDEKENLEVIRTSEPLAMKNAQAFAAGKIRTPRPEHLESNPDNL